MTSNRVQIMDRRCTSEVCMVTATGRTASLDLSLAQVLTDPMKDWHRMTAGRVRVARDLKVDWQQFNQDQYIFSHSTIVSSVNTEANGYHIDPVCSPLVNNNGNAWTSPILLATFRSFVGGENYLEHVQIPELSKGKILDAVVRPVKYSNQGKTAQVYYVDILVATERRHESLCKKIATGELSTMSMGCGLAGTRITMGNGEFRNIEEIEVGDEVLTHTGSISCVSGLFTHDAEDVPVHVLDVVGAPDLRLTAEHPIFIAKRESVRCIYEGGKRPCKVDENQSQCRYSIGAKWKAGELKPCGRDKSTHEYDLDFVNISDVKEGDYVVKPIPAEIHDDDTFTMDMCRLLGMYAGDGYVGWQWDRKAESKKYPIFVEFCFSINEQELADDLLDILSGVSPDAAVKVKDVPERSGRYIKVKSKKLAEFMLEHCGESCYTKAFSPGVMMLPPDKQAAIMSGLIDTDGCHYEQKGSLHFSTSSETLWNQVHLMLLRMRVENTPAEIIRDGSGFAEGKVCHQYDIRINKKHAWTINSIKNNGITSAPQKSSSLCFFYKNYYLMPVKSNTVLRLSARVYNFSVKGDESYLVDNMATHNCLANWVQCSHCGKVLGDDDPNCTHIDRELLQPFVDENGIKRMTAELCGRATLQDGVWVGDGDSVRFIEASWVERPAFEGAVMNHFLSEIPKAAAKILQLSTRNLEATMEELFRMRVADVRGMMTLRVAIEEMNRRKRQDMGSRVAKTFWS